VYNEGAFLLRENSFKIQSNGKGDFICKSDYFLFSGLLAGNRNTNGTFNNRASNGNWWSSSATGATTASNRNLNTGNRGVNRNSNNTANGFSVRCLKSRIINTEWFFLNLRICCKKNYTEKTQST
jgi:uncharacterized protein (TIGR02145 family)